MGRKIAAVATDGIYKTADHRAQLRQANGRDPQSIVDVHVRRLDACAAPASWSA